jgi:hypothetical protein
VKSYFPIPTADPAAARRLVRDALAGSSSDVIDTAELLTSEIVNNAIVHGHGSAALVLEVGMGRVRVAVYDPDPNSTVTLLNVAPSAVHGRGLAIVDALATWWGVEPRDNGKLVWFELLT